MIACVTIGLIGCANFAASVSGTFIGNIASDRVLKEMDKKETINEALENILENNLDAMRANFMAVLEEKAIERLDERKKEIAEDYFGQ